jgi:hypothetical protein
MFYPARRVKAARPTCASPYARGHGPGGASELIHGPERGRRGSARSQERAKIHELLMEGIGLALRKRGYPAMQELKAKYQRKGAYEGRSCRIPFRRGSRIRKSVEVSVSPSKQTRRIGTPISRRKFGAAQKFPVGHEANSIFRRFLPATQSPLVQLILELHPVSRSNSVQEMHREEGEIWRTQQLPGPLPKTLPM